MWMLRVSVRAELLANLLGRIVIEKPDVALEVHGRLSQGASGVWRIARGGKHSLGEERGDATSAFATSARRRGRAESFAEPEPEADEERRSPAAQGAAAPGELPDLEAPPDLGLGLLGDEMAAESLEDDDGGVPAARMEEVGEDADRRGAAAAEEALNEGGRLDVDTLDSEHLATIGAVADDAERLPGDAGEVAAERAAGRSQGIDGSTPFWVEQMLDEIKDGKYDCNHDRHNDRRR